MLNILVIAGYVFYELKDLSKHADYLFKSLVSKTWEHYYQEAPTFICTFIICLVATIFTLLFGKYSISSFFIDISVPIFISAFLKFLYFYVICRATIFAKNDAFFFTASPTPEDFSLILFFLFSIYFFFLTFYTKFSIRNFFICFLMILSEGMISKDIVNEVTKRLYHKYGIFEYIFSLKMNYYFTMFILFQIFLAYYSIIILKKGLDFYQRRSRPDERIFQELLPSKFDLWTAKNSVFDNYRFQNI